MFDSDKTALLKLMFVYRYVNVSLSVSSIRQDVFAQKNVHPPLHCCLYKKWCMFTCTPQPYSFNYYAQGSSPVIPMCVKSACKMSRTAD